MQSPIITSKDNPQIRLAAALLSGKKSRDEQNLFVIEGWRLCADAARSGVRIRQLLITQPLQAHGAAQSDVALVMEKAQVVVQISGPAAARLSDTQSPQGVVAICEKLDNRQCAVTIKRSGHFLLLEAIQDPGNLGAALRTADAMAIDGVFLGPGCADLYSPKVLRASMGGLFRLPVRQVPDLVAAAIELRETGAAVWAAALHPQAQRAGEVDFSHGGAVAIGNEGAGLSDTMLAACTGSIYIPMAQGANSLNAAVAAGILLWEMRRQKLDDR